MELSSLEKIAQGRRTEIYVLPENPDRVVRVPKEVGGDKREVRHLSLMLNHYAEEYFPDPEIAHFTIDGIERNLITAKRMPKKYTRRIPGGEVFAAYLAGLSTVDDMLDFLGNVSGFVEQTKAFYRGTGGLPDLAGKGNIVPWKNSIRLLDYNNMNVEIERIRSNPDEVHVPVDEYGLPIFDMSLRILHGIEKRLLTYVGENFSTQAFNKRVREEGMKSGDFLRLDFFRHRQILKTDPIYGALRFKERREKAEKLLEKSSPFYRL